LKRVSAQLLEEWKELIDAHTSFMTAKWISDKVLRPFLFFSTRRPWFYQKDDLKIINSTSCCFTILLSSINSSGTPFGYGIFEKKVYTMKKGKQPSSNPVFEKLPLIL